MHKKSIAELWVGRPNGCTELYITSISADECLGVINEDRDIRDVISSRYSDVYKFYYKIESNAYGYPGADIWVIGQRKE